MAPKMKSQACAAFDPETLQSQNPLVRQKSTLASRPTNPAGWLQSCAGSLDSAVTERSYADRQVLLPFCAF
jgi:hypothetical protein